MRQIAAKGMKVALVMTLLLQFGCLARPVPVAVVEPENVILNVARSLDGIRLNVSLRLFDSLSGKTSVTDSSLTQLRSAESHYLPVVLKRTLEASGHWGAVRVLPEADPGAELNLVGTIIESNGVELVIHVKAVDASNRIWLDKTYSDLAVDYNYAVGLDEQPDPFQDGFNKIANDLAAARMALDQRGIEHLLETAMLRYSISLSPESFASYLQENDQGIVEITQLPHRDDPMYRRVNLIRAQEFAFTDAVDEHYEVLFQRMAETYGYWRRYSYELLMGNRLLEGGGTGRAKRGSFRAMEKVYKNYREWRMNEDALREITASFDQEITATVIEIEDRVINLGGSLTSQYTQWRRLLRDIYKAETGLPDA